MNTTLRIALLTASIFAMPLACASTEDLASSPSPGANPEDPGSVRDGAAASDSGAPGPASPASDPGAGAEGGASSVDASPDVAADGTAIAEDAGACTSWQPSGAVVNLNPGADLQGAVDQASSGTILKLSPGSYPVGSQINMKSGVSIQCDAGAVLAVHGAINVLWISHAANVSVWGCEFDGTQSGGGFTAAVFVEGESSHVNVVNNNFKGWTKTGYLMLYNSDDVVFSGNTNVGNAGNEYEPVSIIFDDGQTHNRLYFTDNTFDGFTRMGIEAQLDKAFDVHFDRNTLTFDAQSYTEGIALSIVSNAGSALPASGTIWGNTVRSPSGQHGWALEIGTTNMTISKNTFDNVKWGVGVASAPQTAVLDNTFTGVANPFGEDGGYVSDFWVGDNTVDGSTVSGWSGHGVSTEPTLNAPSPRFCAPK